MEARGLSGAAADAPAPPVDWQARWLAPYAAFAPRVQGPDWPERLGAEARRRGVRTASGLPLRFVAPGDAGGAPYESHVAATGRVPTRPLAHDLFNALVWLAWPRAKAQLNAAQAQQIARDGVRGHRGARRDALTLLDENGLLLACSDDAVIDALARHDWREALVARRADWHVAVCPYVFGHALLDKLTAPYKAITAAVLPLRLPPDRLADVAAVDAAAAARLADPQLAPRALLHLPVLGVPGWWPANAAAAFYDDPAVFRPPRAGAARTG